MSNRRLSRRVLIRRLLLTLAVIAVLWVGFAFVALRMPISGEVTYALDWVWGAAQPLSEGGESGWRVTTTAGVEVTVREGYLGSYSLQLIYCPHKHSPLSWLFGEIITARAGHGEGIDVTRYLASAIEPLARPTRFVLGTVSGNEPLYCEGHYLAARPDRAAAEAQPTTSMVGVTLWLSGEYRLPGATSAMPFTFRTSLANGAIRDILDGAGNAAPIPMDGKTYRVIIERRLDRLFEGIDFSTATPESGGKDVLWALIAETRFVRED